MARRRFAVWRVRRQENDRFPSRRLGQLCEISGRSSGVSKRIGAPLPRRAGHVGLSLLVRNRQLPSSLSARNAGSHQSWSPGERTASRRAIRRRPSRMDTKQVATLTFLFPADAAQFSPPKGRKEVIGHLQDIRCIRPMARLGDIRIVPDWRRHVFGHRVRRADIGPTGFTRSCRRRRPSRTASVIPAEDQDASPRY